MKRILQAMDGVATKPVVGVDSMAKFVAIIKKNDVQILQEASPHKVSLPVQMAMQHYQKEAECQQAPQVAPVGGESVVRKYFDQAEQAVQAEQHKKKQFYKQYGQQIAERVLMKEGAGELRVPPPPTITTVPEKNIGLDTVIIGNPMDPNGEPIYDVQDLVVDLGLSAIFAVGGALLTPATAGGSAAAAAAIAAPRIIRIAKALAKAGQSAKFNAMSADGRRQLVSNAAKDYAPQLKTAIKWNLGINTAVRADQATGSTVSNAAGAAYDKTKDAVKTVYDLLGNVTNERHMGFKPQGPGLQSNAPDGGHLDLSELSTDTLGKYKKAAYADAKKADADGDYERGDKRFKGINKATIKQFDNDLKKHNQSPIKEANAKKRSLKNSNPCWIDYKPVGTKKKGGRTVPNCVPKE